MKSITIRIWQIAMAMIATISLISCEEIDDPDGLWDPMIWKTEVQTAKQDDAYIVGATGGTFTFSCSNYSKPWLENVEYAGEYYYPPREKKDFHTITLYWFKAEMKDNCLKVTFEPNIETRERLIKLTVTAGDIFYIFYFKQSANK